MGVSHFCTSSEQRHLQICILDCLSKDTCVMKSLTRQRQCLSPKQRADLLAFQDSNEVCLSPGQVQQQPSYQRAAFPRLRVPHCMFRHQCGNWGLGTSAIDVTLTTAIAVLHLWPLSQESNYFICIEHRGWDWCLRDFIQLLPASASPPLTSQQVWPGDRGNQKLTVGITSQSCVKITDDGCKAFSAVSGTEEGFNKAQLFNFSSFYQRALVTFPQGSSEDAFGFLLIRGYLCLR